MTSCSASRAFPRRMTGKTDKLERLNDEDAPWGVQEKSMARRNNHDTAKPTKKGFNSWRQERESQTKTPRRHTKKRRLPSALRRHITTLVLLAVVCMVCVWGFIPPAERITQGLDIQGGVSVILSASKADGTAPTADEMATATTIVQNRVNSLGASEATVQQQGSNSILVQIPGATDAESAVETIGKTGKLEFVRLDEIGDADALARLSAGGKDITLKEGTYTAFMDGSYITSTVVAQASQSATGYFTVNVAFNQEGAKIFADVTRELAPTHGQIAIVLDGVIQSAPAVEEEISGGNVSIKGNFTDTEARNLKTVLDSGSLPVALSYSESRVVGPTLGQDSLSQGIFAIAVGVAIVVVYLFVFYQGLGLLTMGSLAIFAVLYLGLLALLSHFGAYSLTLPGLAAVVLTTGSAADSSILVLERFREEIRMGRSVRQASLSGVRHGIATSLDADAVTLVTAFALFFVAVGAVKGFGLTLMLGVICDLVTMFGFKAPALRLLAPTIEAHPGFWGVKSDLEEAHVTRIARPSKGGELNA